MKLTPAQIEGITREVRAGSTITEGAKNAGVSEGAYFRWRKRFGKKAANTLESEPTEPKKYAKKSSRDILVSLVKTQLDENPEYAAKCIKLLDLSDLLK